MSEFIRQDQLEYIAEKYSDIYFRTVGRMPDGSLPPVNPTVFAEKILGLRLRFFPLSIDGSILGLSVFDPIEYELSYTDGTVETVNLDAKDIVIDTELLGDEHIGRRNFTIAHENAHHILNSEFQEYHHDYLNRSVHVFYRRQAQRDREEWQADTLASLILMPKPLILDCMRRFGLNDSIQILNRVFRPEEYVKFERMANFLGVSRQALCIRLKQLKLIRKEYLARPYDMVNVYMDDE